LPPPLGSPEERGCGLGLTNQAQRITALQQVPVLSGLSRTVLKELARRAEEVTVPKGAFLCHQGASCDEVSIILKGSFVVRRPTPEIDTRNKGDFIGALPLIEGSPWATNVVAVEESVVLVVHREDFEELLEIPRVARTIMRKLATGLREAEERILELSLGGAESAKRKPKFRANGARNK